MELLTFVMLIERTERYNKINQAMVDKHIAFIRKLDDEERLVLCGSTKGYPGVAGMIVFKAEDLNKAKALCQTEPFVAEGYASLKIFSLRVGNKANNYLQK